MSHVLPPRILLVGCGNMGAALLRGWLEGGVAGSLAVLDPSPKISDPRVHVFADIAHIPADYGADIIVLAVKPQTMADVAPSLRVVGHADTLWLSIAAGKTLSVLSDLLDNRSAIVRAMPNTPALVGAGVTVACASPHVSAEQHMQANELLAAVGEVHWVKDEALMDAVTALSGSGPAYVFLLLEALSESGAALGLPADLARDLALATVSGAAKLAFATNEDFATLRQNVTSPGGTTAAALSVLMREEGGLKALFDEALARACARSRELAS